jgi:hypothetical protein
VCLLNYMTLYRFYSVWPHPMLLSVTKDFVSDYIARQAASDRAKIGREYMTSVALYYIARQAASDLRLTCGRPGLSNKAT